MKKLQPRVTCGTIQAACPKCGEPYMGTFDADEPDIVLKCVNCHHSVNYCYHWPDELPKVVMRYKSSGQLVSGLRKGKRKKKKKTNVLKGQLSLLNLMDDLEEEYYVGKTK